MTNLEIKGERNERNGRQKKQQACSSGDKLDCIEAREEELTGKLQKKLGKGDEAIENMIDEEDEKHEDLS
ncbi:hypothetical protein [Cesiribacter andamanensis]|uniref:CsbD-like protein n=1 Tax=Cesiribacter andamanensis AMV16 TaxID=1279009 RepID=M7N5N3_9BACT|nr:hypothetical protein [Cesiribacter andamanensis]EMR02541.1 hypothetical protein ADICEAN_02350 [Cesiribacter andamanensis AMV16]